MQINLDYGGRCICTTNNCNSDAIIADCETRNALCLNHLHLLCDMPWKIAFIDERCTGTYRDAVIKEFHRVFPEPEPEPPVPCRVCGKQPVWNGGDTDKIGYYCCDHKGTPQYFLSILSTRGCWEKAQATASWNTMRREPVVSAKKWQVWNLTQDCTVTIYGKQSLDSFNEAIKERDEYRRSFPDQTYEIREVPDREPVVKYRLWYILQEHWSKNYPQIFNTYKGAEAIIPKDLRTLYEIREVTT